MYIQIHLLIRLLMAGHVLFDNTYLKTIHRVSYHLNVSSSSCCNEKIVSANCQILAVGFAQICSPNCTQSLRVMSSNITPLLVLPFATNILSKISWLMPKGRRTRSHCQLSPDCGEGGKGTKWYIIFYIYVKKTNDITDEWTNVCSKLIYRYRVFYCKLLECVYNTCFGAVKYLTYPWVYRIVLLSLVMTSVYRTVYLAGMFKCFAMRWSDCLSVYLTGSIYLCYSLKCSFHIVFTPGFDLQHCGPADPVIEFQAIAIRE